jgi:hypothetical protein
VPDQRFVAQIGPVAPGEVQARTNPRTGTGVSGQQADAQDRKVGGRDVGQANQLGAAASRNGGLGEYARTGAGIVGEQVVEAHGQVGGREAEPTDQAGPAGVRSGGRRSEGGGHPAEERHGQSADEPRAEFAKRGGEFASQFGGRRKGEPGQDPALCAGGEVHTRREYSAAEEAATGGGAARGGKTMNKRVGEVLGFKICLFSALSTPQRIGVESGDGGGATVQRKRVWPQQPPAHHQQPRATRITFTSAQPWRPHPVLRVRPAA